jgi:two-component system sensor histidine kinase PilS (NtrC family)
MTVRGTVSETRDPKHGNPGAALDTNRVLYWIYAGRLIVALGVYGAAVLIGDLWPSSVGGALDPAIRTFAISALASTGILTPISYWISHHREQPVGPGFLYAQALFDLLLVTGIVHITGGSESVFPPLLYIALVSGYALILPLQSAVIVALTSGVAYLLDVSIAYPEFLDIGVLLQIVIFTLVSLVSGIIGGRLRQMSHKLSSVEDALERLQLRTSDILGTIGSGVVTLDANGAMAYMNPAAEILLDLDAESWIGQPLLPELADRCPAIEEATRRSLESGEPVREQDVEIVVDDEEASRPVAVSVTPLDRPGEDRLVTLVIQDMRLARRLEELHLRAGRLQAVAELSASLAHEIKNPLASIRSAVEQVADPTTGKADRAMLGGLIVRETDRLSRLLAEFNDFARVDVVERKPIEVGRVIEEAIALVQQRPEADESVTCEVELRDALDDLWGDPDLVHRTLVNLILNAVQVGAGGGGVTVRIVADSLHPGVMPSVLAPGMPVRIRVMDDGPGIAVDDIERIFDPFYTRREGGSGMGLAIAHRAVQAHGGALLVSSRKGQGATFAVILPRRNWRERQEMEEQGWTAPAETRGPNRDE